MQTGVNIQGKYKTKVADPACSFNNEQNVWFRSWTWQTSTFWLWLVLGSPLQTIFWQRETVNDFFCKISSLLPSYEVENDTIREMKEYIALRGSQ